VRHYFTTAGCIHAKRGTFGGTWLVTCEESFYEAQHQFTRLTLPSCRRRKSWSTPPELNAPRPLSGTRPFRSRRWRSPRSRRSSSGMTSRCICTSHRH